MIHLSMGQIVILAVAAVALVAIVGWRAPDRSPGSDQKAQRERVED